jgi:hypothetical protein
MVVRAKAESLADAPLQEFLALLIEHQARDELRERGLHRNLHAPIEEAKPNDAEVNDPDEHTNDVQSA